MDKEHALIGLCKVGLRFGNGYRHGSTALVPCLSQNACLDYMCLLQGSYAFFLLFIFINNYVILPTFVASIISSYLEANLKEHSLVSKQELLDFRGMYTVWSKLSNVLCSVFHSAALLQLCLAPAVIWGAYHWWYQAHHFSEQQLLCAVAYLSNFSETKDVCGNHWSQHNDFFVTPFLI